MNSKEEDEIPPPQRPPSPPLHTTYVARAVHTPNFSAFRPRDIKISSPHAMSHVAWSCDGKKLAAVGIDKITRVWQPEKSVHPRPCHKKQCSFLSRWNFELLHSIPAAIRMKLIMSRGIPHIPNYSAVPVRRTAGSCSGMHGVSRSSVSSIFLNLLQKAGASSHVP